MHTKLKLKDGTEKYVVHGVWGRGGSSSLDDNISFEGKRLSGKKIKKQIEEAGGTEMFKMFDTEAECDAYVDGINDMDGWMGYAFTGTEEHHKIFGFNKSEILVIQTYVL